MASVTGSHFLWRLKNESTRGYIRRQKLMLVVTSQNYNDF